jgi:uncharacterized repeat protein (TIGR04042 family)
MPEMHFQVKWPNGAVDDCYSPSYVIEEYLVVDAEYPVADFVERTSTALTIASERVQARYGFACSSALDQLAAIRGRVAELNAREREGKVKVLGFVRHPPRDARAK